MKYLFLSISITNFKSIHMDYWQISQHSDGNLKPQIAFNSLGQTMFHFSYMEFTFVIFWRYSSCPFSVTSLRRLSIGLLIRICDNSSSAFPFLLLARLSDHLSIPPRATESFSISLYYSTIKAGIRAFCRLCLSYLSGRLDASLL